VGDVPVLRPVAETDVPPVLGLNERNVEMLAPMDEARLRELREIADRFDVVDLDGAFAGFVITFGPGTSYDSTNYRWFSERYGADFYYLDRIVLHEEFRRHGLGSFVYDEMEAVAKPYHRLALEVSLEPRNDVSLAFHRRRGYVELGRLGDDSHEVLLMEKNL
jgi:predicted GNAT superfamily acetyltransferase